MISFKCNICGASNETPLENLQREIQNCVRCHSNVRFRQLHAVLTEAVTGKSMILNDMAPRKDIKGWGMSDHPPYAEVLAQKFNYTNTYYHQEPKLDITDITGIQEDQLDFLISSDVFEHVSPPVQRAFDNAYKLLKKGGVFVFTVPYTLENETKEHFPNLFDYKITQENGEYVLHNKTKDGKSETFKNLIFHGGPGETLECRVFTKSALLRHLEKAGFKDVRIHDGHQLEYGIYCHDSWSLPMSARK